MWPFRRSVKSRANDLARFLAVHWFQQLSSVGQLQRDIPHYDVDNQTLALIMGYGCGLAAHTHVAAVGQDKIDSDVMALAIALLHAITLVSLFQPSAWK